MDTVAYFIIIFGGSIICTYLNESYKFDQCQDPLNRQKNSVCEPKELVATARKKWQTSISYLLKIMIKHNLKEMTPGGGYT